jgi:hypothetical protein
MGFHYNIILRFPYVVKLPYKKTALVREKEGTRNRTIMRIRAASRIMFIIKKATVWLKMRIFSRCTVDL